MTGLPLKPEMVVRGRHEELSGFDSRGVYEIRSRAWADAQGYPILWTRWVDRLKNGSVRNRLCVQEFNRDKGKSGPEVLSAPTPPLVAARYAVSRCASSSKMPRALRRRLMAIDFEKAFLNGVMTRHVCIRLPPEDGRAQGGQYIGYFQRAMYGLRDAPVIWQEVVRGLMADLNFKPCVTMPCVYYNGETDVLVVAHVDDFLACGNKNALESLKESLRQRYACDGEMLGLEEGENAEINFLGRRIGITKEGLEWKADPKQIVAFISRAWLANGKLPAKGVDMPGVRHDTEPEDQEDMDEPSATAHRGLVALANYIAQDRPDVGFAALSLSTTMAKPKVGDQLGTKRLVRYFRKFPTCTLKYCWQEAPSYIDGCSDRDCGSCPATRRSISSGLIYVGSHLVNCWSKKQQTVSLSSCESELNALTKLCCESLNLQHLLIHCAVGVGVHLTTDASAAVEWFHAAAPASRSI